MRVLHYSTWKEPCGIAGYLEDLVGALDRYGVESVIHAVDKPRRRYMSQTEVHADLDAFAAKARDFDLVHVQHEHSFFSGSTIKLKEPLESFAYFLRKLDQAGRPTVFSFHTIPDFVLPLSSLRSLITMRSGRRLLLTRYRDGRRWVRKIAAFFDGRHPNFQAIVHTRRARHTMTTTGFNHATLEVVPLGLAKRNSTVLGMDPAAAREQLGYPRDAKVLSLFGWVSGYKGHDTAVQAVKHLPRCYHLAIVGGPHPDSYNDPWMNYILGLAANERKLRGRVRITGYLEPHMVDLYQAASDVCLAPYHNYPNYSGSAAITWALSSGRPVIASKIPSFMEMNDDAGCLLLFTEGADFELAWQIERVTNDQALRERLVASAQRYVDAHSWPNVAHRMTEIYRAIIGRCGGALPAGSPNAHAQRDAA